jgi:hypothetical protein
LFVSLGFLALYLISGRKVAVEPVADKRPTTGREGSDPRKAVSPQAAGPENLVRESKPAHPKRKIINRPVHQSPLVATKTNSSEANTSATLREPGAANSLPAGDAGESESPLRVEIQTKDPNIRIIWFAQRESKPAVLNSKGT